MSDSPCWKALLKVKEYYFAGRKVVINSGNLARVWHDPWCAGSSFIEKIPELFDICQEQDGTLAELVDSDFVLPFGRRLQGGLLDQWHELITCAQSLALSDLPDSIFGPYLKSSFTVPPQSL